MSKTIMILTCLLYGLYGNTQTFGDSSPNLSAKFFVENVNNEMEGIINTSFLSNAFVVQSLTNQRAIDISESDLSGAWSMATSKTCDGNFERNSIFIINNVGGFWWRFINDQKLTYFPTTQTLTFSGQDQGSMEPDRPVSATARWNQDMKAFLGKISIGAETGCFRLSANYLNVARDLDSSRYENDLERTTPGLYAMGGEEFMNLTLTLPTITHPVKIKEAFLTNMAESIAFTGAMNLGEANLVDGGSFGLSLVDPEAHCDSALFPSFVLLHKNGTFQNGTMESSWNFEGGKMRITGSSFKDLVVKSFDFEVSDQGGKLEGPYIYTEFDLTTLQETVTTHKGCLNPNFKLF